MDSIPLDGTLSAVEVSFLTATQPAVPTYFYSPVTAGKTLTVAGAADVGGALHVSGLASHTVGVTVGNADQAGNTVLDWYLENPFTVTMAGNLTPGSVIFNQDCRYQRIGNRVFIDMYLSIVDPGGATGAITIGGLPFPLNATFAVGASNLLAYPVGSTSNGAMFMSISGTGGFFRQYPTGLSTNIATITTVASFSINGSYQI